MSGKEPVPGSRKYFLSKAKSTMAKNFDLSQSDFEKLLTQLKSGKEDLLLRIYERQLPYSVLYLKKKFGLSREESEGLCLDALIDFREKMLEGKIKYGNLNYLLTRMASNLYIDREKERKRTRTAISIFLDIETVYDLEQEKFFETLDDCLSKLDKDHRSLINKLYYEGKKLKEVAEEENISYANARKRKERIIKALRKCCFTAIKYFK